MARGRADSQSLDLKSRLDRRDARTKANDSAFDGAERERVDTFECLCECVRPDCDERFAVERSVFGWMRKTVPHAVAVADRHTVIHLEAVFRRHATFLEVIAPNAGFGLLDKETLKQHVESVRSELENSRSELSSVTGRITTSLATGAVVVSLFVGVMPEERTIQETILLLLGFIPFLAIAYTSIHGARDIEENWAGGKGPLEQVKEWERDPFQGLKYSPLHIGSYEQWERDQERDRRRLRPSVPGGAFA